MATHEAPADGSAHALALGHMAAYVELLRDVAPPPAPEPDPRAESFWLKLQLDDGRWTVDYRPLPERPQLGDVIELAQRSRWRVCGTELVWPRPARAPRREFLVCAPAA